MEIKDALGLLFQLVILPIIPLVVIYIKKFIEVKIDALQANTDNAIVDKYLQIAEESVIKAVETVTQVYVDELKKLGSFDLQAQQVAFTKAKDILELLITDEVKDCITEVYGDYNAWIKTSIESAVKSTK